MLGSCEIAGTNQFDYLTQGIPRQPFVAHQFEQLVKGNRQRHERKSQYWENPYPSFEDMLDRRLIGRSDGDSLSERRI